MLTFFGEIAMDDENLNKKPVYDRQLAHKQFQLGRVLGRTFYGVVANWKSIFLAILFLMAINAFLSLPYKFIEPIGLSGETSAVSQIFAMVIISLSILQIMFICVFTDVLAYNYFTGNSVPFQHALMRSTKAVLPIFLICVLFGIACYIGTILFIVPGVIISVGWAIIGPIYLHENTSIFGTFGRSWELTKGYKWWIWLSIIIMRFIIVAVALSAILSLTSLYSGNLATVDQYTNTAQSWVFGYLFSLSLCFLFSFYAAFISALYAECIDLKEGLQTGGVADVTD